MKCIKHALAIGLASLALLAGCVTKTPEYDAGFGSAVLNARMAQTLNPAAAENRDPVLGIDGKAAREGYTNYQESFKEPVAAPEVSVGTGSSQSSGAGRR